MFCARNWTIFINILGTLLVLNGRIGHCDVHTHGSREVLSNDLLFDKLLYAKTTVVPTNYTVVFKYEAPGYGALVHFCEFNITANSTAEIKVQTNLDIKQPKTVEAVFSVYNATDLKIQATLRGISIGIDFEGILRRHQFLDGRYRTFQPRSFTLIYEHNATQTNKRFVAFGERQSGDELINHQTKLVSISNRFAQGELYFEQPGRSITCIEFSFDSPSAIAFVDSKFISEDKVNVIVYDLNRRKFNAEMSVYGFDSARKPDTYKAISA